MNRRKIVSVSMLLVLVFSISVTATVHAAQFDFYPPFPYGGSYGWSVPTWAGGSSSHSESVDYTTGKIQLYTYAQNDILGKIETSCYGYVYTRSVYAASSGVVWMATKVTLNGAGLLYSCAFLPAGQHSALFVRLRYEVQDLNTGQIVTSGNSEVDSKELWALGCLTYFPIPIPLPFTAYYSWSGDRDIAGSFSATAGHYYSVYVYLIVSSMAEGGWGSGWSTVDFASGGNCAIVRYVSLLGAALGNPPSGDGGGCPIISVYDGSQYVPEGLLNIHGNSDVAYPHILATTPSVVNGMYLLRLTEHPLTISHIDQVKLYANLGEGTTIQLPLVSAIHSQYGSVLPQLLFNDGWRVDELGAKWNNGTSQNIDLRFLALPSGLHAVSFTFVIEGYNPIIK